MSTTIIEQPVTLWLVNDVPSRMVHAGRRWRVTDTPTLLRHSVWSVPLEDSHGMYGWRFQGTDDTGQSLVFDIYKAEGGWHVHRAYD